MRMTDRDAGQPAESYLLNDLQDEKTNTTSSIAAVIAVTVYIMR